MGSSCPFCAESIETAATKCRHCGETFVVPDVKPTVLYRYTGNCGPVLFFGGGCFAAICGPVLAVSPMEEGGRTGIVVGAVCALIGGAWIVSDLLQGKKRAGIPLPLILIGLPCLAAFVAMQVERTREDLRWKHSQTGPSRAIRFLKSLHEAQEQFRKDDSEGDGRQDFGTLAELQQVGLISDRHTVGTEMFYTFECAPSATLGEERWFAVARPTANYPGDPFFCSNQEGKIFYRGARSQKPFRLNSTDCVIPADATERTTNY